MFSGVRQNSLFYVLEKGENLILKTGLVVSVSNPIYGLPTMVDISVKVNDEVVEFKNLPSVSSIADSGNVIVSDNKESMLQEVESIKLNSQNTLNKIEYHEQIVLDCEGIIAILNPNVAKEKERDKDISNLKDLVTNLEEKLDKILGLLSKKRGE